MSDLLANPSPSHASAQQKTPPAIVSKAPAAKKPTVAKTKSAEGRLAIPPDADGAGGPTDLAAETDLVTAQQDQAVPSADDPSIRKPAHNDVSFPAAPQQLAPASVTQVIMEPHHLPSATTLDDLLGIAPIAEALIKTLAGKARTGRLDEMKALELLQQIVSL